jgi:hypothetical protein
MINTVILPVRTLSIRVNRYFQTGFFVSDDIQLEKLNIFLRKCCGDNLAMTGDFIICCPK